MKNALFLLLALGLSAQLFAQLSTKQIVGTWNYTVLADQRELTGSLNFAEKEGKLTGEVLAGQEGYTFPLTKVDFKQNDSLYFEFVPENEAIKFTVKVEGELFKGSGTIFGNSVNITGEKTAAQASIGENTVAQSSAEDNTVSPPSTEDFNNIDLSKFENTEGAEYFFKVKAYADYMITHGRDRYGKEHSPLFATTLSRETGNVYQNNPPDAPKGIRRQDRTWRGSNTSKDNGLYRILFKLTEITGDERYAQEADKAIKWFFAHCQNPETGFMAWGEHIGWDFFTEAPSKVGSLYLIHEYKGFNYWDRVWKFNPEAAEKFALGLWEHQIYAHEGPDAGEFNRHARYDRHGPGKGRAFPGHGGNFMGVWAKAYQETGKEVFLTAIETLVNYYERNTTDKGAILYASDYPEQYSLKQSMALASNLYRIMDLMPADLANRMKKLADGTVALYLSFDHDPSKGGKGFLKSANLITLEPGEFRPPHMRNSAWTEMWSAGYGDRVRLLQ